MTDPSRPLTLLRTAAGSPPSVTQYRAFRALGCRIVAADSDPRSVGFAFADAAHVVPRVDEPGFLDHMVDLCRRERVDLFLPALDEELVLCARHRERFREAGTRILVSSSAALEICTDKLSTYQAFRDLGIPTPATVASEAWREGALPGWPLVVKPRRGRGGQGVRLAADAEEAAFLARRAPGAVVQAHCPGEELTLDVLADQDGELRILSPRRRLAVESGISSKGETCWREDLVEPVRRIVAGLGLAGPLNIQCFVGEGILFTEVNARIAGTAILTQAAGVPFFQGVLALARGARPEPWLKPAPRVAMLRYWEEAFTRGEGA